MEENKKQYLSLLSEIVKKETVIFGDIAILKARKIAGLVFDENENVIDIAGDVAETIQKLVLSYTELSGQAAKDSIDLIFDKYPQIKKI